MSNADDLQERMLELGHRYLERTEREVVELTALVSRITEGGDSVYQQIEVLAHRIRGSGAMFGFSSVSDAAAAMEILSAEAKVGRHPDRVNTQSRLAEMRSSLEHAVRDARAT